MKNNKFSIIVPVYNTEKYLRTCLDSLTIQTYPDVEFILIDDGSTDNSLEICNQYKERDSRFVVLTKENAGPASARNLGLKTAKGDFISFVDSDDYVCPNMYERINVMINKSGADVVVFGANVVPWGSPEWVQRLVSPRDIVIDKPDISVVFDEVGARPFLWMQVMKRELIVENGFSFDESMNLGEDQIFQIQVLPNAKRILFSSEKFYTYRALRENSLMTEYNETLPKKLEKHVEIVEKVFASTLPKCQDENKCAKTVNWSIFFMFDDLMELLVTDQGSIAGKLVKLWAKYNCDKYYKLLGIWGQSRYDHIKLMGKQCKNLDEKMNQLKTEIENLETEIKILEQKPQFKKIKKRIGKKPSKFKKALSYYKKAGLKATINKIKYKLTNKR